MKNEYTLKDWFPVSVWEDYLPPEEIIGNNLQGYVYGNPLFKEGGHIITSQVISVIVLGENIIVETFNSFYNLININKDYESLYPNVTETLKSLK